MIQGLSWVDAVCDRCTMKLEADSSFAFHAKLQVKKFKPLNQGVVSGNFPKADVSVWGFEAHNLESFLCADRPVGSMS